MQACYQAWLQAQHVGGFQRAWSLAGRDVEVTQRGRLPGENQDAITQTQGFERVVGSSTGC